DKPSKLDQLVAYMKAHSTVQVLDLRPALIEAKKAGVLFLKTDTHWNSLGAFIGCQQLADALSHDFPAIKPLLLEAFDRRTEIGPAGDCAQFIGQANGVQETEQLIFSPHPLLQALERSAGR